VFFMPFWRSLLVSVLVPVGFLGLVPAPALAQTDFYNLDKGRPLRVEDAYSTKRWAFEVKASPLTLSQQRSGELLFQPSLELKHGLFPGVEVSVGTGFDVARHGADSDTGLADFELSALANLWVEGEHLPAAAIRVTSHLPTRSGHGADLEVKGIVTRSLHGPVRAHLNGAVTLGSDRAEDWWVGAALDWVLPFQHTLLLAETWISTPPQGDRRLHSSAGARFQVNPSWVLDAGLGRSWSGVGRQDWGLTMGLTHEFGVRRLIPGATP